MTNASDLINLLARRFEARKYLEIGVRHGDTFFAVNLPLKTAVDPAFTFDWAARCDAVYAAQSSDEFFASFPESETAAPFLENGRPVWDLIFIDGLHTFEQSCRDFENSLRFAHQNTIWLLDDTVPSDPYSALPDQELALRCRALAGGQGRAWHGEVYKTLFAIHDFHPEISYCTVMGPGNPLTVLWRSPPSPDRVPRFGSRELISGLNYFSLLKEADLLLPVEIGALGSLVGQSLAPALYADGNTWEKLFYQPLVTARELELEEILGKISEEVRRAGFYTPTDV